MYAPRSSRRLDMVYLDMVWGRGSHETSGKGTRIAIEWSFWSLKT